MCNSETNTPSTEATSVKAGEFLTLQVNKTLKGIKIEGKKPAQLVIGQVTCRVPTFTDVQKGEDLPLDPSDHLPVYKDREIHFAYRKMLSIVMAQQAAMYSVEGDRDKTYATEADALKAFAIAEKPSRELPNNWDDLLTAVGAGAHAKASSAYNALIASLFETWSEDANVGERKAAIMVTPWRSLAPMVSVDAIASQVCTMSGTLFANADRDKKVRNRDKVMAAMGSALDQYTQLEDSLEPSDLAGLNLLRQVYARAQVAIEADTEADSIDADDEL